MIVSDFIADFLAREGVTHAFQLSGGMITHLLDAIDRRGATKIVSMRHEQAAGFAAEGWARMTRKPGVALATSGPGATNLLTAIASCYFDSVPVVFITGQVPRNELRRAVNPGSRQIGFQETDIRSMARPVTKGAFSIMNADHVGRVMRQAFDLARSDRPGPVLVDIPMDVQKEDTHGGSNAFFPLKSPSPSDVEHVIRSISRVQRPLALVGGGVQAAGAADAMRGMLNRLWIPTVHSLMGKDVLATTHPLNAGFIGAYGNRWANKALAEADLLLVLGSRLDVRQTGANVPAFVKNKRIIHVDVDAGEVGGRVKNVDAIIADLQAFANKMCDALGGSTNALKLKLENWWALINKWRLAWPDEHEQIVPGIHPAKLMHEIGWHAWSANVAAVVVDVGQHQMWAAQSLLIEKNRFLTSGGLGAMGFALPAAIGAALASPGMPIVCIAGDGGFQCNIQELATVRELALPIKMIVLNNHGHGMVRQFQDQYFKGRRVATEPLTPSFTGIASGYAIDNTCESWPGNVDEALLWLFKGAEPKLLEINIDPGVQALPKLAFGKGLDEMDPPRT